jgi:hypothetical protein
MKMMHLNDHKGVVQAWQILQDTGALFVSFAAQGTHLPLLIVHQPAVKHWGYAPEDGYAGTKGGDYHYVGLMEFGGLYPFVLASVSAGYVQDKLQMRNSADALNTTAFLKALGQTTLKALNEYLDRLHTSPHDPTAVDYDYYMRQRGRL